MSPWLGKDENRRDRSLTIKRGPDGQHAKIEAPVPLATARFANRLAVTNDLDSLSKSEASIPSTPSVGDGSADRAQTGNTSMGELLAKLSEQQALLDRQKAMMNTSLQAVASASSSTVDSSPASGSTPSESSLQANPQDDSASSDELGRLKRGLEKAQTKIAHMEKQATQLPLSDLDHATSSLAGLGIHGPSRKWSSSAESSLQESYPTRAAVSMADKSQGVQIPAIWRTNSATPGGGAQFAPSSGDFKQGPLTAFSQVSDPRRLQQPALRLQVNNIGMPVAQEISPADSYHEAMSSRPNSALDQTGQPWPNTLAYSLAPPPTGPTPPITPMSYGTPHAHFGAASFGHPNELMLRGPSSILSPTAAEFNGPSDRQLGPWNMQSPAETMNTTEPLNYRRLLDRNMSCNWKYIVDKIVHNNDQQASIFLQQKLKVSTSEQKHDIVQAIIDQAYPLMVNRFGNFLVQRCFEHGSPEQIIAIARAIRGNTLSLSMDAFGCHVVQKAFDYVPEEYKAIMVHELLRRIPETVIHRYACHVWQKLFELRWRDSPPQIMKYVNEALRGMWHEVALGETGSLVVQNIFENCLEEDKRPCINEVLASIDVVAHGQFGNWCIQHICEHGSTPDRTRATDHVLRFATEYSMDQYASKVVEKCLKIGGANFLDRYLDRVCEARVDRPRMPLIDIAGDQFGNYLVQYIFTHADAHRREIVTAHIRKHMVSLRGSKYGSRVAMLCCNPSMATRSVAGALSSSRSSQGAPGSGGAPSGDNGMFGGPHGYNERGYCSTRGTPYGHQFC